MSKEEKNKPMFDHRIEGAEAAENILIPNINAKIDFALTITGNGMQPKYSNGDTLLCRKATGDSIIQYGKTYILYTKDQELFVRRLMPSDKEGYINLATYNDWPFFELSKDQIIDYYIVVAAIKIE